MQSVLTSWWSLPSPVHLGERGENKSKKERKNLDLRVREVSREATWPESAWICQSIRAGERAENSHLPRPRAAAAGL